MKLNMKSSNRKELTLQDYKVFSGLAEKNWHRFLATLTVYNAEYSNFCVSEALKHNEAYLAKLLGENFSDSVLA